MAKKEEHEKKQAGGKENKDHPQKHEERVFQGNGKEGGPGKGHASDAEFGSFEEGNKARNSERGFEKDRGMENGNHDERGLGNENRSANGNDAGLDFGKIGGTVVENPDLSASLGKLAKNKGCLSSVLGLFTLLAMVLIL